MYLLFFFFFKQKTAYEMRISDWSSDVCSSDLKRSDAFAGDRELLADLFQRVVGVHADSETHAKDALLAGRQAGQHPRRRLAQVGVDRRIRGQNGVVVLDEVAEKTGRASCRERVCPYV